MPFRCLTGFVLAFTLVSTINAQDQRYIVELRNGMRLGPGTLEPVDSVSANTFQRAAAGEGGAKIIDVLNDGWRKVYYNATPKNVIDASLDNQIPDDPIKLPFANEVNRAGNRLQSARIVSISAFKPTGRRALTVVKGGGKTINVIQQITEIYPDYVRLELLRGADDPLTWDSREALSSIPSDQLNAILEHNLDLTQPNEWQRLCSFNIAAGRYTEAIRVLNEGIRRFPTELGPRKNLIAQWHQQQASKQFEEISLRREAGQWKLANELLSHFPKNLLEAQINAKNQLEQLQQELLQIQQVTQSIKERVAKLPDADRQTVQPLIDELLKEISVDSAVRLDDYVRLSGGNNVVNENMVALAIGGWLLGPGSGIQNFATAKSLINVRKLVREYLGESTAAQREIILNQLQSEEGSQPPLVAKLIATMQPPLPLPDHQPTDPPGLYRHEVKLANGEFIKYTLQLPPEYDPNRKYPCILALPGTRGHFQMDLPIDFWCGQSVKLSDDAEPRRFEAASRWGYIVISPNWMTDKQSHYQYTEGEKLRILACFRDAMRRTSVNTDKVFITGHFEGATAAWDIVSSHPDMWAGAILLSPTADKYIIQYHSNLQASRDAPEQVPPATYIVYGELDDQLERYMGITNTADRYLRDSFFDCLLVQHIGQERGLFTSELPRIFQWMQLSSHQRLKTPRVIDCVSLRPGDRMYYWLEAPRLSAENSTNSFQFDASQDAANKGKFEASLLDSSLNGVRISKIPSDDRSAVVWFTPDMVDFGREVTVMLRDKRSKHSITGRIDVMLEDVRTRADRVQFFWDMLHVGGAR